MKNLIAALLACAAGVATADPAKPCNAPSTAVKWTYIDLASTLGGFDCAPKPIGDGTLPTFRSNAAGSVAWWYCPSASGHWKPNWAVATAARLSGKKLFDDVTTVVTAADPKAAFNAVVAANVKLPLSDPSLTPVWCPFVAEMAAGAPRATGKPTTAAQPATANSRPKE